MDASFDVGMVDIIEGLNKEPNIDVRPNRGESPSCKMSGSTIYPPEVLLVKHVKSNEVLEEVQIRMGVFLYVLEVVIPAKLRWEYRGGG